MNSVVALGLLVDERELSAQDPPGIARRWKVSGVNTLAVVILTSPGPGRWTGPAAFLCTCRGDRPDALELPDCGHISAVKAVLALERKPAA